MGIISIAVAHLVKAGVSGDALVEAIAEIEAEIQSFSGAAIAKRRASDAERQQKAREKKHSHVTSRDACDTPDKVSPQTPFPINPEKIPPIVPPNQVAEAVGLWNSMADRAGLERVIKLTRRREAAIRQRIADFGVEGWQKALEAVEKSPFHCGSNDRGWRATIDFVASESKFIGLIERGSSQHARAGPKPELAMPC